MSQPTVAAIGTDRVEVSESGTSRHSIWLTREDALVVYHALGDFLMNEPPLRTSPDSQIGVPPHD